MTIKEIYKLYINKNLNICLDTRSEQIKNSIFFGINGHNYDGNKFAKEALEKGASIIIVDNCNIIHKSIINVKNTLSTLQELASIHRDNFNIPIIGITGSNGKTTTKEILASILKTTYKICSTKGNLNNHIGVPLTILSLNKIHQIGIVEMGANHVGEIQILCNIAKPTHGIITNISQAHIGEYGNIDNVIKTKNELYNYLKNKNGTIIYNKKNKILKKLINNYNKAICYSLPEQIKNEEISTQKDSKYSCKPFIEVYNFMNINKIKSKIIGSYNINNMVASILLAKLFNVSAENIKKSIESIELKNNRSEYIELKNNSILLDAYNANPDSMKKAIINFIEIKQFLKYKNMLFILGDMRELGTKENSYHQEIIDLLEENKVNNCILVGKIFNKTKTKYKKVLSIEACIKNIKENDIMHHSILIKGSRNISLEKIIKYL